jgi:hypothetical protein
MRINSKKERHQSFSMDYYGTEDPLKGILKIVDVCFRQVMVTDFDLPQTSGCNKWEGI